MIDFKRPDYVGIFQDRLINLNRIRQSPEYIPALKLHYKHNPIDFINDWGCTVDSRNAGSDTPTFIPFILQPRQEEMCRWILDRWQGKEPGVIPKSREVGASWTCIALSCALALFNEGIAIGFGSRKEIYVDNAKDPLSLLWKGRTFLEHVPFEFRAGFDSRRHAPHMRIEIPETKSIIKGEAGDAIGRGDRTSLYFVDEAAFLERAQLVENSLSFTTNCRIDLSSVNGRDNPFSEKMDDYPSERVFIYHWRDDLRKDQEWYDKKCEQLNPLTIAQELDLDRDASKEGILIPQIWVQAAIDAHIKLNLPPSGDRFGALDVADKGKDLNCWTDRHGIVLLAVDEWSGKGSDIFYTVEKTFVHCDELGLSEFTYDADGLGAGVRGDSRVINERPSRIDDQIEAVAFQGSGSVIDPDLTIIKGDNPKKNRTNKDFFANRKAQGYWGLRTRFQNVYRWVVEGVPCDPDKIISLSSKIKDLSKLCVELSQPTYKPNGEGKIVVDKQPDDQRSPNKADSTMILYAPGKAAHRGLFG